MHAVNTQQQCYNIELLNGHGHHRLRILMRVSGVYVFAIGMLLSSSTVVQQQQLQQQQQQQPLQRATTSSSSNHDC
ncbi:hypothetical protein M0804_010859 [Polistes exclamans]|nr:hypothetical protein M0804_010859 [Polistes exclamans]